MDRTTPFGAHLAAPLRAWAAIGVALAVGSALSFDPAPTGIAWWDPILTAAFVLSVIIGSTVAPPSRLLPALAVVGVGSASPILGVLGAVGACWVATAGARPTPVGPDQTGPILERSWLGIVAAVGLLQLESIGPFGTPSVVAAIVVSPLAAPLLRPPARRWTALATIGLAIVGACGVVAGVRAGTSLRAASDGLDRAAVGRGDIEAIDAAGDHLRDARDGVQHWTAEPARLIPVLSQHLQVVETLATAGVAASDAGVELVEVADELSRTPSVDRSTSIDLDTLAFARDPLTQAASILEQTSADLDGPARRWLIPAAAAEVDRADVTIDEFASRVDVAALLADELPGLLGDDEPRAYLVLVTNPAEARRGGGIVGAFVDLTVDAGSLRVARVGRETELNWAGSPPPLDPDDFPASFLAGDPHRFVQNWTDWPEPGVTARAAMELYPAMGGREVDGVITVDPWALASLLDLAGPIEFTAPGGSLIELDTATLPDFLLKEQYARFPDDRDRSRALAAMVGALFQALETAELTVDEIGDVFAPMVDQGRLTFSLADTSGSGPNPLLTRLGLGGTTAHPDDESAPDRLSVVHTNGAGNKLDAHLERSIDYRVSVDASGVLDAEVRVTLRNTAEPDALPDAVAGRPERTGVARGTNVALVSVLTPHRIESVGTLADPGGVGEAIESLPVGLHDEAAFTGGTVAVSVEAGQSVTIVWIVSGTVELGDMGYALDVGHQPLARNDTWTITLDGHRIAQAHELTRDSTFRE